MKLVEPKYNQNKLGLHLSGEAKVIGGIAFITVVLLIGGVFLLSKQDERLNKPLLGQEVGVISRQHVPDGTPVKYDTNPPAGGNHYPEPAHAGLYTTPPPDGNLVHSLEHGAVILWYRSNLPPNDVYRLTKIFEEIPLAKKIMTPRDSLDVSVALSSWDRVLKLKTIDEAQIKAFFDTNMNRGPEQAPI